MNAFVAYRAAGGKETIDRFWPMEEREVEKPVVTKEVYDLIMSRYKSRK
jgi:hypothetical protein